MKDNNNTHIETLSLINLILRHLYLSATLFLRQRERKREEKKEERKREKHVTICTRMLTGLFNTWRDRNVAYMQVEIQSPVLAETK